MKNSLTHYSPLEYSPFTAISLSSNKTPCQDVQSILINSGVYVLHLKIVLMILSLEILGQNIPLDPYFSILGSMTHLASQHRVSERTDASCCWNTQRAVNQYLHNNKIFNQNQVANHQSQHFINVHKNNNIHSTQYFLSRNPSHGGKTTESF